ncbi:MAG TPA: MOSC domain-containing protein [Terriglobia bacterium]|nr:MOSC domain-containing protein [Terriglobia bacterium]
MRVVSVNVGLPREVTWQGGTVATGIFKQPVEGRVKVRKLNLDGDRQADLSVHGGPTKAVYAYPSEHYPYWRDRFPEIDMPWGMFGENLTVEGLREDEVNIGDRLRIGSAEFMITSPRIPCYKLGIKFGRKDIIPRFLKSLRSGFYFSVVKEGEVGAGDSIRVTSKAERSVTVADIVGLYIDKTNKNPDLLQRAIQAEHLPAGWRDYFARRL